MNFLINSKFLKTKIKKVLSINDRSQRKKLGIRAGVGLIV